ncbi:TPA_asm: hypothetical protein G4P13_004280 [Salmonella enterica subsp. enterica serovar Carrau]|nr:hypothetical protein [Salmonella enterica subsp. enterica]HAE7524364.1 hypothetical protein [Salmonella enterica subsp. enterica serovar Carrau]
MRPHFFNATGQYRVNHPAVILECYGDKQPSWHALRKDWGDQGAVLVRFRLVNSDMATDPEVVGIIN